MTSKFDPSRGQIFSVEDGVVVVEYYHFGEDVLYEFAEQIRFDETGQTEIARLIGRSDIRDPDSLATALKDKFVTHYAVRDFADEHGIPYEHRRDLNP